MFLKRILLFLFVLAVLQPRLLAQSDMETVGLYLGWGFQFQFAGYLMAQENGYYRDEGLQVEFFTFDGSPSPDAVLSGRYAYGVANGAQLISHPKINELLVVAPIFQQSPLSLVVKKDTDLQRLKDVEGRTLAVGDEIKIMMKMAGVDLEKINFETPNSNISNLETGIQDGNTHYITDMLSDPTAYVTFRPIEYGINFYGECLITTQAELISNADRVARMKRATLRGWEYAIAHTDEAIRILKDTYGSPKTSEQLREEAEIVINTLILPSFYEVGHVDRSRWSQMVRMYSNLEERPVNVNLDTLLFTNDEQDKILINKILQITGISGTVLLLAIGILLFFNSQLRKGVRSRTRLLEKANVDIIRKNDQLKEQKDQLENLNHFKDRMLSIISHDVKGPLGSIQGLAKYAESDSLTMEEFKTILSHTGDKIREMSTFLDNILFWAKNQLHGLTVNIQDVNLYKEVVRTTDILSFAAKNKHIEIQNKVEPECTVQADSDMLQLILRNLISNAVKFCSEGDQVIVSTNTTQDFVHISIRDSGPGISKEQLEQLFGPDVVSTKGSKDEMGTGLGLLLCREFVEHMQGEIGVDSQVGEGSDFWFRLKRK